MFSVTAVGATRGVGTETAAFFSGGGFSDLFEIPSYQTSVVTSYIEGIDDLNEGLFNPAGRGYPDVAFNGMDFNVINGGMLFVTTSTSFSTSSFAAFIALINAELLSAGKPVLGFLNPLLYESANAAITDIISGDNPGCGTDGFSARAGWDPVCSPLAAYR